MLFSTKIVYHNKRDFFIDLIKISIIVFMSVFLINNFFPFFYGADTLLYGASGVNLAKGTYGITNDLLQETGSMDFVPPQWIKTIHNTAIPIGSVGIYVLSAAFYLAGGYYGLFYLGPIFTILLLIFSERIATNLFGRLAGLVTLVIISADFMTISHVGSRLLTDNIFALFFILGCFFLLKFIYQKESKTILLSSVFFAASAFFRLNGVIFLPIEILIILGCFVFQILETNSSIKSKKYFLIIKQNLSKLNIRKILKNSIFLFLPWIIFFLIFFGYNSYYFGDPLTSYLEVGNTSENQKRNNLYVLFEFDSDRFEMLQFWSVGIIQDQLKSSMLELSSLDINHFTDKYWLSIFLFLILISALIISLFYRKNKKEVLVFITFISGTLFIYSSSLVFFPIREDIQERHMIFNFILASMLFGFIIQRISEINFSNISVKHSKIFSKSFQSICLIIFILFIFGTFYNSPVAAILKSDSTFYDPIKMAERYPLNPEVLSKDSIVVDARGRYTIEFNAIPFYPYRNYDENLRNNTEPFPQKPIEKLKKLMDEGYDTFVFKKKYDVDACYFRYLEAEHGLILKEHSKGICKIISINNINDTTEESTISDSICYKGWDGKIKPKWEENKKTRYC